MPAEPKHSIAIFGNKGTLLPMRKEYDIIIERDTEGYFVASVPALPGCHTQAKSLDTLQKRISEAISLWLEDSKQAPEPVDFVGIQRITIEA